MSIFGPRLGRDGWLTQSAVGLLAVAPIYASLGALHPAIAAGMVSGSLGTVGATLGRRYRFSDFWALSPADRQAVRAATRSGTSTGRPDLDALACRILADQVQGYRAMVVIILVLSLLLLAIPVVAAVRVNPWWVLADLPFAIMLGRSLSRWRDPRPRLRALTEQA